PLPISRPATNTGTASRTAGRAVTRMDRYLQVSQHCVPPPSTTAAQHRLARDDAWVGDPSGSNPRTAGLQQVSDVLVCEEWPGLRTRTVTTDAIRTPGAAPKLAKRATPQRRGVRGEWHS